MQDEIKLSEKKLYSSSYSPNSHKEMDNTKNYCYGKLYSIYIRRRIKGKLKLIKIGLICDGCSQVSFDKHVLRENCFINPKKL